MGLSILIVDDATDVRRKLVELVSCITGVTRVEQAPAAAEAWVSICNDAPDVVVLDIRMAGISGIDLLRRIRAAGSRPLVVMLTNYSEAGYRQGCLDAGANFFFDKSTEWERAFEVLEQLAGTGRSEL